MEEYQRRLLAEKYLVTIRQKIAHEKRHIELLEKKVESEHRDVKRLEKLSIHLLLRSILGDIAAQREIEKQEYLPAITILKDAHKSIALFWNDCSKWTKTTRNFTKSYFQASICSRT